MLAAKFGPLPESVLALVELPADPPPVGLVDDEQAGLVSQDPVERVGAPVVVVDDRGVGRLERLGVEVPLGCPRQRVAGDAAGLGHRRQAHLGGLGDDDVQQVAPQVLRAAGHAAGVDEAVGEPCAGVDLDQHRRNRDAGQHRGELVTQGAGLAGTSSPACGGMMSSPSGPRRTSHFPPLRHGRSRAAKQADPARLAVTWP